LRFDAIHESTECFGRPAAMRSVTSNTAASQPSASDATRMRSPGFARSSVRASKRPACAAPARPTVFASGSASCSGLSWSARGSPAVARGSVASRITVASSDGFTPASLSARITTSASTGASTSAPKRSSHWLAKASSGRRHTSSSSVVADARPRRIATASSSGPHTKLAAASPPLLSRDPPGAPITTSDATTSERRPAAARSRPSSSAESPARDVAPSSSDETPSGSDSAAWTVAAFDFSA
jgi:hypothetical protein